MAKRAGKATTPVSYINNTQKKLYKIEQKKMWGELVTILK